ncbi:MAG: tetratricopeptide repeat protein [Spirochaetales bacterium]
MSEHHGQLATLSQEGYQYLRENRLSEATESFSEILRQDESNCYALVGLGDVARKRGERDAAVDYYARCLENDPENSFALFGLADSYRSLRKYREAVEVWERYLKHDDTNVTVLTRVADGYRKLRNKRRSAELYERVLELEAENPYALIGLGHLHYDHREYQQALGCWTRMLSISGARVDIRVLTSIGNCHRKLKQFAEGIPYFEQALESESGNFYALFGLADCYRGLNQQEKSLEYWNAILEKDPHNKVILTRAGDAYRSLGELDQAASLYKQALSIANDLFAKLGLAIIARLHGDFGQALSAMENLIDQDPDNHRIYVELAHTYAQAGQTQDAVAALSRFNESGFSNPYIDELIERYRRER